MADDSKARYIIHTLLHISILRRCRDMPRYATPCHFAGYAYFSLITHIHITLVATPRRHVTPYADAATAMLLWRCHTMLVADATPYAIDGHEIRHCRRHVTRGVRAYADKMPRY